MAQGSLYSQADVVVNLEDICSSHQTLVYFKVYLLKMEC
jgi:hypothetical protein